MYIKYIFITLIFSILIFNFLFLINKSLLTNHLKNITYQLLLLSTGVVAVASIYLVCSFNNNFSYIQSLMTFDLHLQFFNIFWSFGLDGFSLLFFALTSCIIFVCCLFIWHVPAIRFYGNVLLSLDLILLILFATRDLFVLYLCFEILLIPMFLLIGIEGSREKKIRAAYLFFFYTFLGSFSMILALLYIYNTVGSFALIVLQQHSFTSFESKLLWLAFFIGFSSKIPMFPFHIWLPEAHVEAPTAGSVILAGILLKLGVYGFVRVHLELFHDSSLYFAPFIFTLCTIGVLNASFAAIAQQEIKRLVAYSSVAHMNLLTMGIFCNNLMGFEGAILQCLSHAFVSSGLFFLIGCLYSRYHTKAIAYYSGLTIYMPLYSILLTTYTFANIALPGTSAFTAEFMMLSGIYNSSPWHCYLSATSVFFGGAYSLWANNRILFGNPKITHLNLQSDLTLKEIIVLLLLLLFVFYAGINANIFVKYIDIYCCNTLALYIN